MLDDKQLLRNYVRRGDVESLSALVSRHGVWMMALLRGLLGSPAEAEDAFQNTWLKVIKSSGNYRGGNVRAYLATAARSAAIDLLRRRGREIRLDHAFGDHSADEVSEMADPAPSPDVNFESASAADDIFKAVESLPDGPRHVFLMRVEAELSFREISEAMGVPMGTALTWMHFAKRTLKRRLERLYE